MDKPNHTEYYRAERAPYYIVAPDYKEGSSGIRVLHYLCHILNLHGYEAYVQAGVVAEDLWVPQLDDKVMRRHYMAGRKPVVIYPEVVAGTPLGLGVKIRYLLNKPGFIAGHKAFDPDEIMVAYREQFIADSGAEHILFLPASSPSLFNPEGTDPERRHGRYFFYYRLLSRGGRLLPVTEGMTEISPAKHRSLDELAVIFKGAEILYCYEDSAIALEARLCGCPVVYIPNDTMLKEHPEDPYGQNGTAWGNSEEEIARAKATVHQVYPAYMRLYEDFREQLPKFITMTQEAARQASFEEVFPLDTIRRKNWPLLGDKEQYHLRNSTHYAADKDYTAWLKRKSLQEIDGQILAERMMKSWQRRPHFNIVLEARQGEENLLADSIDSIAAQWYPDWHLTLITDFEPADPALAGLDQITWIVRPPELSTKTLIDAAIANTPGDWLFLLEPGNTLEAHTLAYFADTINLTPQARLLYCDEDVRDTSDQKVSPRFKPDFNLELLRNMYYFGPALAIEKTAFVASGGWSNLPEAALYDISLRLLDQCGHLAIVHQPDMLLHTPEQSLRPIDAEAEQNALSAHVDRQKLNAHIETGLLSGTQKILYSTAHTPRVSIIIPTCDQPGYLSHCIESLLAKTQYPDWELILVDHDTQDPDALNFIDQLTTHPALTGRMTCVRTDGPFNYARLCNLGAQQATGDYLLFLDNDTEMIQPTWLDALVGYACQDHVGAVGPRLSKPDTHFSLLEGGPRVLGMAGLAGAFIQGKTNILEPGYCGRLQVAQDVSALSGSCFMTKKALFDTLKGFNEIDTPLYEPILEYCLRLGKLGQRMIWTPWVDVAHHGCITRSRLENDVAQRAQLAQAALAERDYLYTQHLGSLAHDPFYHRHLSLIAPCQVEPHAVIDWDTRFHDRLRILGQPLSGGSGEYRMRAPFRALQRQGLAQTCHVHLVGQNIQRVLNPIELARAAPDVLMLQQAIDDVQINQLKQYRKFTPDIFVTYAVDDVLGNLPRKHYLYNFQAREGKSRMREGLAHCDRLIVSTEPIAAYCRNMIDDIVVVPNRLDGHLWLQHRSQRGQGKRPRVGWAGAQQHLGDLEMIQEVVEALYKEVEWVFMGMCPAALKPFVSEEHPFVPWAAYPEKLASLDLDLAIAPLEQHFFNEGKSNLRLLEYGAMAWPVVCTDIFPFQTNNAPVKRVDNTVRAWTEAIRERIYDLDAAYKEGDQLRDWVLKHYIIEDHINEWLNALTPSVINGTS